MTESQEGEVLELLPSALITIRLADGEEVTAHVDEESRISSVVMKPGDRVQVKRAALDPSRGRIVAWAKAGR